MEIENRTVCPNCGFIFNAKYAYIHSVPEDCIYELTVRLAELKEEGECSLPILEVRGSND